MQEHTIYNVCGYVCGYIWHKHFDHKVISILSVRLRLFAILDARCFLPNGQQNCRAKEEDDSSTCDAVRPREVPLRNVELNPIAVNFHDEHDRVDNDGC